MLKGGLDVCRAHRLAAVPLVGDQLERPGIDREVVVATE
jgi:hypothetical protein